MNVHFIGIGGIGVSALAQFFLSKGHKVSGSDLTSSEITNLLEKKGAKIKIGKHSLSNLSDKTELVIHSPAINFDNPELRKARRIKAKIQSYPQALGDLTREYFTIAIAGTHGKSTTASMLSLIMVNAGMDPTVILGTKLKEFKNSNFRAGKSKYLVIEADEYQSSFLNYSPKISLLTNIEEDHLDYFKNIDNILKAFSEFLDKSETIIVNRNDQNIKKIIKSRTGIKFFGPPFPKDLKLKVPGNHNLYNALGAITIADYLGIEKSDSIKYLKKYDGAWRRFESVKIDKNIVISDYGHHPTEVEKTLSATREKFNKKHVVCIFQPHQYERTAFLLKDFVKIFQKTKIDKVIILDIYEVAGRESKIIKEKINSKKLVELINRPNVIYIENNQKALKTAIELIGKKGILLIMGAGSIHNEIFLKAIKNLTNKTKKEKINK